MFCLKSFTDRSHQILTVSSLFAHVKMRTFGLLLQADSVISDDDDNDLMTNNVFGLTN